MDDLRGFETSLTSLVLDAGPEAPRRIVELCLERLPLTGAGITVMSAADHQQPLWASDAVAARIDELQFRLAEGPCVEAFTMRRSVIVADITDTHETRWPMFAAAARETPARAMVVLPLQAGSVRVGILDFYRDQPGVLDPAELAAAQRAADAAFWSLLGLRRGHVLDEHGAPTHGDSADPHGWLAGAPLEHAEVYQATGMIISQLDVSADTALARLRAHAFLHDRPIGEVAHEVVARRLRFSGQEDR
ncbi:GAF and ANTAR domain-containing protein [Actinomycetospora sp.]|uniref:GAF and ANTAR domain-containing protein n=1 Tax=Actinomycetospora sp. TaxID=1872135 RepID=UPI002F41E83E